MSTSRWFRWQATDGQGRVQSGHVQSAGPQQARLSLHSQGLRDIALQPCQAWRLKRVRASDITLLTRQLATLLHAGLPLLQALAVMRQGLQHPRLQDLLWQLQTSLETGLSLSESCQRHPAHFSEVYVQLVAAGEQGGLLDVMLARLASHMESSQALQAKVRAALSYPIAVLGVAAAVVAVIMVKVVPSFTQVFASYGAQLPWPTLLLIAVSDWLQAHLPVLLLGLAACLGLAKLAWQGQPKWRALVQRRLLHLPVLGTLLRQVCLARWTRTLATLCSAGVPLVEALRSAGLATGHVVFREASAQLAQAIRQGSALSQAMQGLPLHTPTVLQLCAVGEASGTLDSMLNKAADILDGEVQNRLSALMSLLEPALMVLLGGLIGGMVIAMYLPIFKIGQVI